MSAPTEAERATEKIDNVLACLVAAQENIRCVLINAVNWTRPDEDRLVTELLDARREILKAKDIVTGWHPDRRNPDSETNRSI